MHAGIPQPRWHQRDALRLRERALIAEAELLIADDKLDEAAEVVRDLLTLDSRHAYGLELSRILTRRTLLPMPPTDEERTELEATRGLNEELAFAEMLVRGVQTHQAELDQVISESSTNWRVPRMAMVDRNILRMATYEFVHLQDIPSRVTLNEAIELGKRYGTSDSGAFINGLLDKVASRVRGETKPTSRPPKKGAPPAKA